MMMIIMANFVFFFNSLVTHILCWASRQGAQKTI